MKHSHTPTFLIVCSAILAVCWGLALSFFGGQWLLTGSLLPHKEETKIVVAGAEVAPASDTAAPKAEEPPFDAANYTPDIGRGEQIAAKCKACHSFDNGGPNRVGPNQWGIYGSHLGHRDDFSYSSALLEKKKTTPNWDEAALDGFLKDPKGWMPGTKMQFNGIKKPDERADLIAWLKTLK
jgi:cytochrome c